MNEKEIGQDVLKQTMKEALVETLNEQRDLFRDVFAEALEDFALVEAIKDGEKTEIINRDCIFKTLEGKV